MKKPSFVRWGLFMLFTWSVGQVAAQDPFFTHFYHNRSDFNPALVGHKGAFSIQAAFKDQWRENSLVPYQTYQLTIEEGLPCSLFDYGLTASRDVEGDGFLQTIDLGGRLSMALLSRRRKRKAVNIRLGFGLHFIQKSIDFQQLTFADQLNNKYGLFDANGNPNATSFPLPATDYSPWFFAPSVGLVGHYATTNPLASILYHLGGFSIHNLYSIGPERTGNIESLLGLETKLPVRFQAFYETEIVLLKKVNRVVVI